MKKTLTPSTNEKPYEWFLVSPCCLSASRSVETESPPFYDMPTESNLCASGSWLDASPEHHFETNPWRGIDTLFSIFPIPYNYMLGCCCCCLAVRAFLGYLELYRAEPTHDGHSIGWDCDGLSFSCIFHFVVVGVMGQCHNTYTVVYFQASRRSLDCAAAGSLQ